jgi:hypothetical protein
MKAQDAVEYGQVATIPRDDVVRWLRTWGTPAFSIVA